MQTNAKVSKLRKEKGITSRRFLGVVTLFRDVFRNMLNIKMELLAKLVND